MTKCSWIPMFLAIMSVLIGVQCRPLPGHLKSGTLLEHKTIGTQVQKRSRRESQSMEKERCALLTSRWMEFTSPSTDGSHIYRLRILPSSREGPRRPVFPEQPLFRFVRQVYHCCQKGYHCGTLKGIQGLSRGDSDIEFVLGEDVLTSVVVKAELHLQISNPQQLHIQPLLPTLEKRKLPTRYSTLFNEGLMDLRVDLLQLFRALQQTSGKHSLIEMHRVRGLSRLRAPEPRRWAQQNMPPVLPGEGTAHQPLALELGLVLHCSMDSSMVPCQKHGVRLAHTPFISLSFQ